MYMMYNYFLLLLLKWYYAKDWYSKVCLCVSSTALRGGVQVHSFKTGDNVTSNLVA
jgi:hypothetical protein